MILSLIQHHNLRDLCLSNCILTCHLVKKYLSKEKEFLSQSLIPKYDRQGITFQKKIELLLLNLSQNISLIEYGTCTYTSKTLT